MKLEMKKNDETFKKFKMKSFIMKKIQNETIKKPQQKMNK